MKKFFLFFTGTAALLTAVTVVSFEQTATARPTGISGVTGTQSCNGCHTVATISSNASNVALTSDIPSTGYIPGTVYNVSLTIKSQKAKAGFNLRAQNAQSSVAGTFSQVSANAKITENTTFGGVSGELTHEAPLNVVAGKSQVSFKWTAPAAGTGTVTYLAAVATGVNKDQMDSLNKVAINFKESSVTSIDDATLDQGDLKVYPTRVKDNFTVSYELASSATVRVSLHDMSGAMLKQVYEGNQSAGLHSNVVAVEGFKGGTYLVRTFINGRSRSAKIFIEN